MVESEWLGGVVGRCDAGVAKIYKTVEASEKIAGLPLSRRVVGVCLVVELLPIAS